MEMNMFVYSGLSNSWSRLLDANSIPDEFIYIKLTPEKGEAWDEIGQEKMSRFCRTKLESDTLPQDVVAKMVEMLGEKLTHRLLHYNYLGEVSALDIILANRLHTDNDGVPFEKIKSGKKTTPKEAALRLRELRGPDDYSHIEADAILCQLLISLGCSEVAEEFEKLDKWYA